MFGRSWTQRPKLGKFGMFGDTTYSLIDTTYSIRIFWKKISKIVEKKVDIRSKLCYSIRVN